jgi:hypothetical protein
LDFRSNGQQLQYSLDPDIIEEAGDAIGTGPHPLDPGRTVLYPSVETEGLPLLETVFAVGNRVRFKMDTDVMFGPGASLGTVLLYAFGVDPLSPPVNELRIGLYIGLGADFNGDGVVDAADYTVWRNHFGLSSGAKRADGDANADGAVDAADYAVWRKDFGKHF